MSQKKLSIQSSVLWNSIGSICYLGCQWLLTVLVVKLSGIPDAGTLTLAMTVCNIWYCIAVYGMRNFQVSDANDQYTNGTYIFSRILTCSGAFLGCLIYTLCMPYEPQEKLCILFYFLYKTSEALFDVYAGIFQKQWRLDYAGKSMILRGILTITGFSLLLVTTHNIVLTIGVMALLCLGAVFLYDIPTAKKLTDIRLDTRRRPVFELLRECLPLVIYTLFSSSIASIPRLFMERILGQYYLGIYGSVATPTLIVQMGATYVFNPFITLFAERYHQKDRKGFLSALWKCVLAVFAIAVAAVLAGKFLGVWGLTLLLDEEVASYSALLIPLILCTILTAYAWLLCGILTAIREFRGLILGNLAAVLASFVLSPYLEQVCFQTKGALFGMQGASFALMLSTLIEILVLLLFMILKLHTQFSSSKPNSA